MVAGIKASPRIYQGGGGSRVRRGSGWADCKLSIEAAREMDAGREWHIWDHATAPDADDGTWPEWDEAALARFRTIEACHVAFRIDRIWDRAAALDVDDTA